MSSTSPSRHRWRVARCYESNVDDRGRPVSTNIQAALEHWSDQPFEIIFENADFMPHNLVLVKPKGREKIGLAAAAMKPDELDAEGRLYVPSSSEILAASKMLQAGQRESLKLTAPSDEGQCEYLCTFPGHYQVMWGRLFVTKDVEAYLQANPEAPAALPDPGALLEHSGHSHNGEE